MDFEKLIIKKVPLEARDKLEFGMMRSLIKENNLSSKAKLLSFLDLQISYCREWLAKNKNASTINDSRREYTKKLEVFDSIKNFVEEFL